MHINHLSQIFYKKKKENIIVWVRYFSKIDFKFYSNITTHKKTYGYV